MAFALIKQPFTFYRGSNLIDVSEDDPLPVTNPIRFDDNNISFTPLGSGGVFTGVSTELKNTHQINVIILSSHASAEAGIDFQFSEDNVVWYSGSPKFTHSGTNESRLTEAQDAGLRTFQLDIAGKYFRVKYTNGVTAQSIFQIQTILLTNQSNKSTHRVGDSFSNDRSVEVIKSVIAGLTPSGRYKNQRIGGIDPDNSTFVAPTNTVVGDATPDHTTDTLTLTSHGLTDGEQVVFSTTDTLPEGISDSTVYYIFNSTANDFQLKSSLISPTALDFTSNGLGTLTVEYPGTFEGEYEETEGMSSALVFALSDKPLSSIQLAYSADGVNPRPGLLSSSDFKSSEQELAGFYLYLTLVTTFVDKHMKLQVVNGSETPNLFEADTWFYDKPYTGSFLSLDADLSTLTLALVTRAVISGVKTDGSFGNVRIDDSNRLRVADSGKVTHSGSRFVESIRDDISLEFTALRGQDAVDSTDDRMSIGGTANIDKTEGQGVFAVPATAGSTCFRVSKIRTVYEAGHTIRGEQTIELDSLNNITGDADVRWGFCLSDDFGDIDQGIGWGVDATGLYAWRRKYGVDQLKIYRSDFNRDKLLGQQTSQFVVGGERKALIPTFNNLYEIEYEWLGIAPIMWGVMAPFGELITANVDELPNTQKGTSVPDPEMRMFIRIQNDTTTGGEIEVRTGSWRGGIYSAKQPISAADADGIIKDIGRDGSGSAQNNYITGVDENAEIGTKVKTFDPEILLDPNDKIETFQFNVVSGASSNLPLPGNLTRVRGLEFTNTSEDSLYYREIDSNITGQGNLVLGGASKEKHYGNKKGINVSEINPIFFEAVGLSSSNDVDVNPSSEDANTGVTPTNAMFADDGTYAVFDSVSDSVTLGTFDSTGITDPIISNVTIYAKARKESGAAPEISNVGASVANDAGSSTTVTSGTITAEPNKTLLIFIARRATGSLVTNITNTMGYSGFTQINLGGANGDINNGNESRLSAFLMDGTPTQDGTISAIMSSATDHEVFGYVYLENVDRSTISVDTFSNAGINAGSGAVNTYENGVVILATSTEINTVSSHTNGFTEIAEDGSPTNNDQWLNIAYLQTPTANAAQPWGVNLTASGDICVAAIAFKASDAANPILEIANNKGFTNLVATLDSESPNTFTHDITAAINNWTTTDLDSLQLTVSPSFVGNAAAEVDRVYVVARETGGNVRVVGEWIGDE